MNKQEKIAVKNSLLKIKDSLFRDAWEDIVEDHPFVTQDDDDIEDDAEIIVQSLSTEDNPIIRGRESIKSKSNKACNSYNLESGVELAASIYDVTFDLIKGVAIGVEANVGFYVNSKQAFYRPYSDYDGAISFASNSDEAAYLRSLGYVSFKELKDADNN